MLPDPNYMVIKQRNTRLNWKMRFQLILWLAKVHSKYHLREEILFLAINCLDRFLSLKEVSIDRLQLVGTVALSIAVKYEDRERVTMKSLRKLCCGVYKAEDFRKAEVYMLDRLRYKLGWPGPLIFVRKISEIDTWESGARTLAEYLLEAILPDKSFVAKRPSITAAAAYCLARCMLGIGEWVRFLVALAI
jgi:G2/mitotic-specific cyclin 3/4